MLELYSDCLRQLETKGTYIIEDVSVIRNCYDEVKNGEKQGYFRYSRMRNIFDSVAASLYDKLGFTPRIYMIQKRFEFFMFAVWSENYVIQVGSLFLKKPKALVQ